MITRRGVLEAAVVLPMLAGAMPLFASPSTGFTHSVASGDPEDTSVILWTRFVGRTGGETVLRVEVATDEQFRNIVARSSAEAGPLTDFCAHAAVGGLKPGRWYFYRFLAPGGEVSPVGRTRTLPRGRLDAFRIGVVGCANATSGWFNAYAHAAACDDLDLIVHTGDYIYESPVDRSDALADLAAARGIAPKGEAISLADYRLRYASYRTDPALIELHRRLPMIAMWDDHEVANNSWQHGAKNHGAGDGSWEVRKAAGVRAFREWLPMRRTNYARYQIGDLATMFRLETRLTGRSEQLDLGSIALSTDRASAIGAFAVGPLADAARTMMGARQEQWLADGLAASTSAGTPWQLLAQQVVMGPSRLPKVVPAWRAAGAEPSGREQAELDLAAVLGEAGVPTALDRWDGYPAARRRLFDSALRAGANLVVLSGDSHNAWANDLEQDGRRVGVEFAGQSVSSLGIEKRFGGDPATIARDFLASNPALRWCDTSRRGYMVVQIMPDAVSSEWRFLASRDVRSAVVTGRHMMSVGRGAARLA